MNNFSNLYLLFHQNSFALSKGVPMLSTSRLFFLASIITNKWVTIIPLNKNKVWSSESSFPLSRILFAINAPYFVLSQHFFLLPFVILWSLFRFLSSYWPFFKIYFCFSGSIKQVNYVLTN